MSQFVIIVCIVICRFFVIKRLLIIWYHIVTLPRYSCGDLANCLNTLVIFHRLCRKFPNSTSLEPGTSGVWIQYAIRSAIAASVYSQPLLDSYLSVRYNAQHNVVSYTQPLLDSYLSVRYNAQHNVVSYIFKDRLYNYKRPP